MVQFDQTSVLGNFYHVESEEVRRLSQRPVQIPLTSEVQHRNRLDSSIGGVFCLVAEAGDTIVGAARPMTG